MTPTRPSPAPFEVGVIVARPSPVADGTILPEIPPERRLLDSPRFVKLVGEEVLVSLKGLRRVVVEKPGASVGLDAGEPSHHVGGVAQLVRAHAEPGDALPP